MNGSEFIWRQEIEGRGAPWWLRRVDRLDGLLAIAAATFAALSFLNGVQTPSGG